MDQATLQSILETIAEGIYFVDVDRRIRYWNKAAERITGYSRDEVTGSRCSDNLLRHVDGKGTELCLAGCPLSAAMSDGKGREADVFLHHKHGHRVPVSVRVNPVYDEARKLVGAYEIFVDGSERSQLIAELEQLKKEVLTDPLTGLGNRRFAEINVTSRFSELCTESIPFGVLILDIDHFKKVNDTYGHANGDRVLRMVAWTLANAVRRLDSAIRWGGEEFLVISPGISPELLEQIAERIRTLVQRSWIDLEDGRRLEVTVSVGGSLARREEDYEALVARADKNLYFCKEHGRNRVSVG